MGREIRGEERGRSKGGGETEGMIEDGEVT